MGFFLKIKRSGFEKPVPPFEKKGGGERNAFRLLLSSSMNTIRRPVKDLADNKRRWRDKFKQQCNDRMKNDRQEKINRNREEQVSDTLQRKRGGSQ